MPGVLPAQSTEQGDPDRELRRRDEIMQMGLLQSEERENKEDVRGRVEWFDFQRRFPYSMIPAGTRTRAVARVREMEERASASDKRKQLLAGTSWQPIGPSNIGGRVRAIAQHPTKAGVYFVGAAAGGVWKTIDSGRTWHTTFDKQSALAIGGIAIDYSNPRTVYAATGEFTANSDSYLGNGIFKSTDEGETWTNVGLSTVGSFAAIAVHRQRPNIVYAVGAKQGGGFYRSTDAGGTWSLIQSLSGAGISVNPINSDDVLIATANTVLRSTDAGLSWSTARGINAASLRRISVAHAPSDPSIVFAVAARYNGSGDLARMYRSTDGGSNWTQTAELGTYFFRDQGWYNNCIAVHPDSPNVVLAGGIDIFRSDDAGVTWGNFTDSYGNLGAYDDPSWVHPDQHVIEFSPIVPGQALIANDGGVHVTPDGGFRWRRLSLDLPISQFYRIDVDPFDPRRVYGGTQDNGSLASVLNQPGQWRAISGGDGFWVAVDPFDPTTVYSEIYFAQAIYRVDTRTNTVTPIHYPINEMGGERGDWSSPLACSPYDGRLYSARVNLYRTSDQGNTWQRVRTGASAFTSAIALSYQTGDHMLIGTANGEIRVTKDDGATWTRAQGIPGRYVTDIKFDPNIGDRVYATVSGTGAGHVFRSDDGGYHFTDITANLPDVPTNTVAVDPDNIDRLFVGTDAGVLVSLDGGKLWLPFNQGLPYAPVIDLRVAYGVRTLIAATHGRSAFSIDITNVAPEPLLVEPGGGETFAAPGRIDVQWIGLVGPARVELSLDGGDSWMVVVDNATGTSTSFDIGLLRSTRARVRVEEIDGERRAVSSGMFTIAGLANGSEIGSRGLVAEAIEIRGGELWASDRDSDSLVTFRLPLLAARTPHQRTGLSGRIRDLAYDGSTDRFYVLTGASDFSDARLWVMDTTATAVGEIPLPVRTVRGVSVVPQGIALAVVNDRPEVIVIDTAGREVRRFGPGEIPAPGVRRSLAWDGHAFVQGAIAPDSGHVYATHLERLHPSDDFHITQRTPMVLNTTPRLDVVGLAFVPDTALGIRGHYWATDTAGKFYRFVAENVFAGVDRTTTGELSRTNARVVSMQPNPARQHVDITWSIPRRSSVKIELVTADGRSVRLPVEGVADGGAHSTAMHLDGVASGIYYVTLTTDDGARVAAPLVVVR